MMRVLISIVLLLASNFASAAQEVQPLLRGSYQKMLAARAGQPFVVALWSVSCTHCGADLEILARLLNKYPKLNLVLVSTDSPEQEADIVARLHHYHLDNPAHKKSGKLESWVFADSYTERLYFEVDAKWYGELPRTYFFDANGKSTAISGVLDAKQTERWVSAIR
jgi:hypothetical protein